jgi:SAM-dependent methyltransferase
VPQRATAERWTEAQEAEREFWTHVQNAPATVGAIVRSLTRAAEWARDRVPVDPGVECVEIGIGPLGLGVAHFLRAGPGRPPIVGVDPLALDEQAVGSLPDPLARLVDGCRAGYEHVVAPGEQTGLEPGRFGAAFLANMLDHVAAPGDVLRETRRLLRRGGNLFLACDVFSAAGILKHQQWNRRRRPNSILVRAHPHRFSHGELIALVERAGFVVGDSSYAGSRRRRIAGRAQEVYVHAVTRER